MKDKQFLQKLYDHLLNTHNEKFNSDIMTKLHAIIQVTNSVQETPNTIIDFCTITGSEITFNMTVPLDKINEVSADIYEHPSKFSDYSDNSDSSYYKFLKFLWITFPNGQEEQLVEFVDIDS